VSVWYTVCFLPERMRLCSSDLGPECGCVEKLAGSTKLLPLIFGLASLIMLDARLAFDD